MSLSANNLLFSSPVGLSSSVRRRRHHLHQHPSRIANRPLLSSSSSSPPAAARPSKPLKPSSPNPLISVISSKAVALASSATAGTFLLLHLLDVGGGSGFPGGPSGGGGGGDGGGGGGGGGGFWSRFFRPSDAMAKDRERDQMRKWDHHDLPVDLRIPLYRLNPSKKYFISDVTFLDTRRNRFVSGKEPLLEMVTLRSGEVYSREQISKELEMLKSCGMFRDIAFEAKTMADGTVGLQISFSESYWRASNKMQCINVGLMKPQKVMPMDSDATDREKMEYYQEAQREYDRRVYRARKCMFPCDAQGPVNDLLMAGRITARKLQQIRELVQKWYHDKGFACAQVVNFGNLNTEELVIEVMEGDITDLQIQFQDKLGNICEGNTDPAVIYREIPKQLFPGRIFNIEAGKQALRNINSLGLFSNIEVNPRPDDKSEGGIIVELKLKELDQKSAEVSTEWSIVPGRDGKPTLASIQPGGTVTIEHRNIKGLNRSVSASITSSNLLNPQDDLSYKLEYVHPYWDGVESRRNRAFRVSCFNSRKLSPVFTGGPGADEVPAIWVDRAGVKANLTEAFTRQSKFTYGLVMEEITTRDEASTICTNGSRSLPTGGLSVDGPPTTLSGTGVDRIAFLQANITRDNTKFVNGAVVGDRNIFQVDQGLGIGSNFPFFNRHQLTITHFHQLRSVVEGAGRPPPPVLVLHGHYGGCVGDLPNYDAFTLGGPYSVRGYNMGELGAARNILELAAELRVPVRNTHAYAFVEHGTDLGSSKAVKGNPTEFFRRAGQGSSYGVGLKLGLVRAEYAIDNNAGTGSFFFRFGERF